VKKFLFILVFLYILTTPFYIFESGLPQPSDFLVTLGALFFIFSKQFKVVIKLPISKLIAAFVFVIASVNLGHFFALISQGIHNTLYFPVLFYVFNALFFFIFIYLLLDQSKYINIIALAIISSLVIQGLLITFGVSGGVKEGGLREIGFFNNPNQLAYFSLLMVSLYVALPHKFKSNKALTIICFLTAGYLIFYSGSRAALSGLPFLFVLLVWREKLFQNISSLLGLLFLSIAIPAVLNTDFVKERINLIESRNHRNIYKEKSEAEVRGYDRIWNFPEQLILGAGEGARERFGATHELHSGPGTVLFSYGILGFAIFSLLLYYVIRHDFWQGLVLLLPVMVYNLTHQGLRNSLFWALLAAVYISTLSSKRMRGKRLSNGDMNLSEETKMKPLSPSPN